MIGRGGTSCCTYGFAAWHGLAAGYRLRFPPARAGEDWRLLIQGDEVCIRLDSPIADSRFLVAPLAEVVAVQRRQRNFAGGLAHDTYLDLLVDPALLAGMPPRTEFWPTGFSMLVHGGNKVDADSKLGIRQASE